MPLYRFGLENQLPETAEGEELADDDAARRVAAIVGEEMGRHCPTRPKISIFDMNGDIIAPFGWPLVKSVLPSQA